MTFLAATSLPTEHNPIVFTRDPCLIVQATEFFILSAATETKMQNYFMDESGSMVLQDPGVVRSCLGVVDDLWDLSVLH